MKHLIFQEKKFKKNCEVKFFIEDDDGNIVESSEIFNSIYLGRFPVMLQSELCVLHGLNRDVRYNMGECRNDYGGYFIIDGKEKVMISQEKFADNMLYIRDNYNDIYSHGADIRTVSEDASKPERTLSVRIVAPNMNYSNNQIVVNIPNVRKPIPLFIRSSVEAPFRCGFVIASFRHPLLSSLFDSHLGSSNITRGLSRFRPDRG